MEALEDRLCIASEGSIASPTLSPQSLIDCDKHDGGCQGGFLDNAWRFLRDVGVDFRGLGGTNSGTLAVLDDVTSGLDDNASAALDNSGPGLGAGGAARGVVLPLLEQQVANLIISNRTVSKAELLSEQFSDERIVTCGFDEIALQAYDVIINATSASLSGSVPPISEQLITKHTVCYDMVYAKELTPFLAWSKNNGAKGIIDGLGMLVYQAKLGFQNWYNMKPEVTNDLRAFILKELLKHDN